MGCNPLTASSAFHAHSPERPNAGKPIRLKSRPVRFKEEHESTQKKAAHPFGNARLKNTPVDG